MSFLKCLRYINPNSLVGSKEIKNRILTTNLLASNQLLKLDADQFDFNQKRFGRFKTVKRRHTHKKEWWPKKTTKLNHNKELSIENQEFINQSIKDQYSSPLVNVNFETKVWTPQSKRTGLIARKIGEK